MSEPTIYNEIALKIKGQQKEVEKLRKENYKLKKELKLAEENEEYWHNAFSDLEDEYARLKQEIEEYKDTETYSKRFLYKANKERLNANLKLVNELEDYKSRCEKAVEFIEKYCIDDEFYINLTYKEKAIFEVLNILNGKGDE